MNKTVVLNAVKRFVGMEVKLESAKLADGTTVIEYDSLEPKSNISVINSEGQPIPMPVGKYELEDGTMVEVVTEGEIEIVTPKEEKPMENPEGTPEAKAPEMNQEATAQPKKLIESSIREIMFSDEFKEQLKAVVLEAVKPAAEPEKTELSQETEEKAPEPIVVNPEKTEVSLSMNKSVDKDPVSNFLNRIYS